MRVKYVKVESNCFAERRSIFSGGNSAKKLSDLQSADVGMNNKTSTLVEEEETGQTYAFFQKLIY